MCGNEVGVSKIDLMLNLGNVCKGCLRQEDPAHKIFLKFSILLFKLYIVENR